MKKNQLSTIKTICIGAGGHAHAVLAVFKRQYPNGKCVVFDSDPKLKGKKVQGFEIIGSDDFISAYQSQGYNHFIIAVGMVKPSNVRERLFDKMISLGLSPLKIIDPSALIMPDVRVSEGCTIMAGAIINSEVILGKNVIINSGAIIEHESVIKEHSHIAPGVIICGCVTIGKKSFIGAGSVIVQETIIPDRSLITPKEIINYQKK